MAAERRPAESWELQFISYLPHQMRVKTMFLGVLVLSWFSALSAQAISEELLCRAGTVSAPVQAGINYTVCPDSQLSRCEQLPAMANGQDTANVTVPVNSLVTFRVRFSGYNNPLSSVAVMPTRLRARVTAELLSDNVGPYAVVRWFNSTSDITAPFNCLELVLDPPGLCAFQLCRKDCTTPQFQLDHLADQFESLGGVGTRTDPFKLQRLMPAQVGDTISFTLKLRNVILTDLVDIEGRLDGGVPIGMEFMDKVMEGTHTTTRTITWVPHKGQEGQEHVAHFVGWNCPPVGDTVPCPVSMVYLDVHFAVDSPVVGWFYPDASSSGGEIPDSVLHQPAVVGQTTEIELACRAVDSSSVPVIELLRTSVDGEAAAAEAMGDYDVELEDDVVDPAADRRRVMRFKFTPEVGDEGGVKAWCFQCGDSQGLSGPNERCVELRTRLCEVHVQAGDTLQTIARRYHLDRNWRRLWNLNPDISNPYVELHPGAQLRVGPLYRVRNGDALASIAARFETTVKKVLMVNPHLGETDAQDLPVGLDVCVLPCTDKPPPSHFVGAPLMADVGMMDHE